MGLSKQALEAAREATIARHERHRRAWQEAQQAKEQWRREMLTAALTAEMLGISTRTLRRWVSDGKLSQTRLGDFDQSPIRFRRADVEHLKESIRSCSPSSPRRRLPGR